MNGIVRGVCGRTPGYSQVISWLWSGGVKSSENVDGASLGFNLATGGVKVAKMASGLVVLGLGCGFDPLVQCRLHLAFAV